MKTSYVQGKSRKITVEFITVDSQPITEEDVKCMTTAAESIRLAARIVDTPCSEMHTDQFLEVHLKFLVTCALN